MVSDNDNSDGNVMMTGDDDDSSVTTVMDDKGGRGRDSGGICL